MEFLREAAEFLSAGDEHPPCESLDFVVGLYKRETGESEPIKEWLAQRTRTLAARIRLYLNHMEAGAALQDPAPHDRDVETEIVAAFNEGFCYGAGTVGGACRLDHAWNDSHTKANLAGARRP